MYARIVEAVRLARKGKVAEATAFIRRALGRARPDIAAEPMTPEPPTGEASETGGKGSAAPFTVPTPTLPGGLPLTGVLKGPAARGPSPGRVPLDAVVPAAGQWIAGDYTGPAGTRTYKLYVPSGCHGQCLPLIVMLHGCTQGSDDFAAGTRMNFLAEAGGLLVAYPEQTAPANGSKCWNWFQAAHQERDQGEPSLIAGITRQVMAQHRVDVGRVYVAGLSAGGAMAAILATAYSDLYAAVGVHSGLAPGCAHDLPSAFQAMQQGKPAGRAGGDCTIPLILFQGDRDQTVHPCNADHLVEQWAAAAGPQTPGQTAAPATVQQGQVADGRAYTREIYHDIRGQAVVERWTVHGAGHAWSGGSRNGSFTDPAGPDASRELVRFFQEHPQRSAAL